MLVRAADVACSNPVSATSREDPRPVGQVGGLSRPGSPSGAARGYDETSWPRTPGPAAGVRPAGRGGSRPPGRRGPCAGALPGGCLYEPKWDGFRCVVARDDARVDLWSRQGTDLTPSFPDVAGAAIEQVAPGDSARRRAGGVVRRTPGLRRPPGAQGARATHGNEVRARAPRLAGRLRHPRQWWRRHARPATVPSVGRCSRSVPRHGTRP
ncbi:ATP-dependent DNA ligase [Krasilnikoviella flava]|uniref:ATP-dependent DNA ligase n=1 Tax=Krasilnikoviella flava TaxID=526729 RepID=UPI003898E2A2